MQARVRTRKMRPPGHKSRRKTDDVRPEYYEPAIRAARLARESSRQSEEHEQENRS